MKRCVLAVLVTAACVSPAPEPNEPRAEPTLTQRTHTAAGQDFVLVYVPGVRSHASCRAEQVADSVAQFVTVWNEGSPAELEALLDPGFRSFSVDTGPRSGFFVARTSSALTEHFSSRRAQAERMRVTWLEVSWGLRDVADFAFRGERAAHDLPSRMFHGKGAVQCPSRSLIVWSVADDG